MAWPRTRPSARSTLGSTAPTKRRTGRRVARGARFHRSGYSRAFSAQIGDVDQRLRALERRLETAGSRSAASAAQAVDHVGESVASALSSIAQNLRGRANSMPDEVAKIRGGDAQLGYHALRPPPG